MKIAYFVDRFPLISETFILAQITGMIDRGHDVQIYARRGATTDITHSVVQDYGLLDKTFYIPAMPKAFFDRIVPALGIIIRAARTGYIRPAMRTLNPFRFGREALSLRLLLRAAPHFGGAEFDILHCQFGHLGIEIAALQKCGALQGVLIATFRGTDAMKFASRSPDRFSSLFQYGHRFLCVSAAVRDKLVSIGCPVRKTEILRSGIDLSRFEFRGHKQLHDPVRVLSVGRLAPNKGIEFSIRAVRLFLDAGYCIQYQLVGDGPTRERLQQLAVELNLTDVVTFSGALSSDEVIQTLCQSDVLVAPSITGPDGEQEGLPNAPKEAMAIGVPVVATNLGGVPELVCDQVTGFLVDERCPEAIAGCLRSLVDSWPALGDLVVKARQKVEQEFEIQRLNDQLESAYLSVVN